MTEPGLPAEIAALRLEPAAPLVVVDVDEVLAMFMRGFERFVGAHGYEMRINRFALFQNIYRPGEAEHLDVAAGRALFERFFEADVEHIDPAPGAGSMCSTSTSKKRSNSARPAATSRCSVSPGR